MKLVVIADAEMQKEFESKGIAEGIEVHFETSVQNVNLPADAYFYLLSESSLPADLMWITEAKAPVFVNAVVTTLNNLPKHAIRINAWPGFIQRPLVEICASEENKKASTGILNAMNWNFKLVPDVQGFIAGRVISMIINEAYFALGDDVSTKENIDVAMRLGTNYPLGPFEWGVKVGLENIYYLLKSLSETDIRYSPAPLLTKETSL